MSRRTTTDRSTRQPRAAIYTRVSTADQEQEGTSLDTQLDACRQFAIDRALVVDDAHVYREVYTGTELWQRPRLTQLREAMRAREIDVVVAYAIDRLSRDPVHLGVVLTEAEHAGVDVFFVTEPLDHSPEGQLIRFVRGYAAKVEHEKIKERTMRGRLARAKAGKLIPGWKPLYGYRFADDAKTRYEIDEVQASVVKRIFGETLQGISRREIARRLTSERVPTPSGRDFVWPLSTIGHMLANAHYTGRAAAFCQRNPRGEKNRHQRGPSPESDRIGLPEGTIPGIVDLATFAGVQDRLERNKQASTRSARDPEGALLRAGIVRCGYCEQKMHVRRVSVSGPRYMCANYGFEGSCGEVPSIGIPILDRVVWDQVQSVLTRPEVIAAEIERLRVEEPNGKELIGVDRALAEVGRRQRGLIEQLALVDADTAVLVREQLAELSARRRALESEKETILNRREAWQGANARFDQLEAWCGQVAARLGTLSYREKRLALESLNIVVKVWKRKHTPRYEISATLPLDQFIVPVTNTAQGTVCSFRRSAGRRGTFR